MATKTLIPVEEYLRTQFDDADRDYVDGEVIERNMGETWHSRTQKRLALVLAAFEAALGVEMLVEIRIQINPHRYRVADLAVWRSSSEVGEPIPVVPPFLAVEILSPEDRMSRMAPRIRDYFDAGVEWVWLIDTEERIALVYSRQNPLGEAVTVLHTENPVIEIPLESLLS
jgi:Uma2 family endonuclease